MGSILPERHDLIAVSQLFSFLEVFLDTTTKRDALFPTATITNEYLLRYRPQHHGRGNVALSENLPEQLAKWGVKPQQRGLNSLNMGGHVYILNVYP